MPVNYRVNDDKAHWLKGRAAATGISQQELLDQIIAHAMTNPLGPQSSYIPKGARPENQKFFKDNTNNNRKFVWVWWEPAPGGAVIRWILPATLEGANQHYVAVRPSGGLRRAIEVESLVAWIDFTDDDHVRAKATYDWLEAGAYLHRDTPSGYVVRSSRAG